MKHVILAVLLSLQSSLMAVGSTEDLSHTSKSRLADEGFWNVAEGIDLYHFSVGVGEEVLVIHGGPGYPTPAPWKASEHLGDRLKLHFYHQRGCGFSTKPIDRAPGDGFPQGVAEVIRQLGLWAHVQDIESIRRLLGKERLILVGHSFGAMIAALYAAQFPDRVKGLIFVAPANLAVLPKEGDDLFAIVRKRLPSWILAEYGQYLRRYFDFPALFQETEDSLSEFYGRFKKYYWLATEHGSGTSRREREAPNGGWMTLGVYLSMGQSHDYRPLFAAVQAPVLVIHGGTDLIPESDSSEFTGYFQNSRLEILADSGHFPFNERPAQFAQALGKFIQELR